MCPRVFCAQEQLSERRESQEFKSMSRVKTTGVRGSCRTSIWDAGRSRRPQQAGINTTALPLRPSPSSPALQKQRAQSEETAGLVIH